MFVITVKDYTASNPFKAVKEKFSITVHIFAIEICPTFSICGGLLSKNVKH